MFHDYCILIQKFNEYTTTTLAYILMELAEFGSLGKFVTFEINIIRWKREMQPKFLLLSTKHLKLSPIFNLSMLRIVILNQRIFLFQALNH